MNDVPEGGGTHSPGPHQLHGLVEVLYVVGVHPQEGRVLQQDIAEARPLAPGIMCGGKKSSRVLSTQVLRWTCLRF